MEHKMRQNHDFVNGEWKRKGEILHSAARRNPIHHNDQTLDLVEQHLAKEMDDRRPVFSFTNIELALNTAAARQAEDPENNVQGTLGSTHTGQTTQDNGTLQAMSDTTPLTGGRGGDEGTLQSLDETADSWSSGSKAQLNDEAMEMEVDEKAAQARKMQDRETVKWMDAHQAEEAHIQAGAGAPSSHSQQAAGGSKKHMSDEAVVKWADEFQVREAQQRINDGDQVGTSKNNPKEPWLKAKHEHKHPDNELESEAGSVDARAYPGATLDRFAPGAQTFAQLRGQGRNKQFKEKWLKNMTKTEAMQLFDAYSASIDQHWETTRPELRMNRWEPTWVVLQRLHLIVRELRPQGWGHFGDYVCG